MEGSDIVRYGTGIYITPDTSSLYLITRTFELKVGFNKQRITFNRSVENFQKKIPSQNVKNQDKYKNG